MTTRRGGEYDRWDLDVRLGALATARARMTIEEHGTGRQLIRLRIWPRFQAGTVAGLVLLWGVAAAAFLTGNRLSAAALAAFTFVLGLRTLQECGAAVATIVHAADRLLDRPPPVPDAPAPGPDRKDAYVEPIREVLVPSRLIEGVEVDA